MVHGNRFLAERDRANSNCSILLAAACFLPQLHAITAWLANPVVCLSERVNVNAKAGCASRLCVKPAGGAARILGKPASRPILSPIAEGTAPSYGASPHSLHEKHGRFGRLYCSILRLE